MSTLGSDPPLNPHRPRPTPRAVILHRLDRSAGRDVPLAAATAFRRAQ